MKFSHISSSLLLLSLLTGACVAEDASEFDQEADKADQISGQDDPSGILGNAERRLAWLISSNERGQTFGVDTENIPYPDTYWPYTDNGIAASWMDKAGFACSRPNNCRTPEASPLEKFTRMTGANVGAAMDWEHKNHGQGRPGVSGWWGHCPGWVAGAMLNKPILHSVLAKADGNGGVIACNEADPNCTTFEIGDINALSAEAYENSPAKLIGSRCDTNPDSIQRDQFGRVIRNGRGCKGLNAGSMLILMANRLKMQKKPFAIDVQNADTTGEIWNQPAFAYTVNRFERLDETQAANLVASGRPQGPQTRYQWNNNAQGFALVDFTLLWVTETPGPNETVVRGINSYRKTRMVAVIELDSTFDDSNARIIGGEYIDDPSVGADRLSVAPFAWVSNGMGPENSHNPYVNNRMVQQLINMGNDTAPPSGGNNECTKDICEVGEPANPNCGECVASICAISPICCESVWTQECVDMVEPVCNLPFCE